MVKMKLPAGPQKQKELPPIQTVSDTILGSCYIASVAIVILAGLEAAKQLQKGSLWSGVIYIALALAGILFSVFNTLWNRRNKKILQNKKRK